MTYLPFMSVVEWSGEVVRDGDGLIWYLVGYQGADGVLRHGWMADHDLDGMTGLAPYRPSISSWQFGDDAPPLPRDPLFATFGYGEGADGWAKYSASGSAAQFLNMQALAAAIGLTGAFPAIHKNLCGQLAVFRAVDVSLEEGIRAFSQVPGGLAVLQTNGMTSASQLAATFDVLGWSASVFNGLSGKTIGKTMEDALAESDAVIVLVTGNKSGTIVAEGSEDSDGHWIQVTGITQVTDANGESDTQVEYYNSAKNNDEALTMSLDVFLESYRRQLVTASQG